MAKGGAKAKAGESAPADAAPAVMDLRMDASNPAAPRELTAQSADQAGFQTPCTVTGLMAGLSGGSLGYVFGFGGYWMRNIRGGGVWKTSLAEGWASASTFAIMGGLYAAVNCFMLRLRKTNDAWNGAASGCATGLALGWKQGPLGALQSCGMLGVFSYFIDSMGAGVAEAATVAGGGGSLSRGSSKGRSSGSSAGSSGVQQLPWWQQGPQQCRGAVESLLSPALPLLAAVAPCSFGASSSQEGGCAVVRRRR